MMIQYSVAGDDDGRDAGIDGNPAQPIVEA